MPELVDVVGVGTQRETSAFLGNDGQIGDVLFDIAIVVGGIFKIGAGIYLNGRACVSCSPMCRRTRS